MVVVFRTTVKQRRKQHTPATKNFFLWMDGGWMCHHRGKRRMSLLLQAYFGDGQTFSQEYSYTITYPDRFMRMGRYRTIVR